MCISVLLDMLPAIEYWKKKNSMMSTNMKVCFSFCGCRILPMEPKSFRRTMRSIRTISFVFRLVSYPAVNGVSAYLLGLGEGSRDALTESEADVNFVRLCIVLTNNQLPVVDANILGIWSHLRIGSTQPTLLHPWSLPIICGFLVSKIFTGNDLG